MPLPQAWPAVPATDSWRAAGSGGASEVCVGGAPLLCFWWRFGGSRVQQGWWVGPCFGGKDGIVAHCPSSSRLPPRASWQVKGSMVRVRVRLTLSLSLTLTLSRVKGSMSSGGRRQGGKLP